MLKISYIFLKNKEENNLKSCILNKKRINLIVNAFFPIFQMNLECPPAMDGMERFACPTPDRQGRYRCIDDHVLCDGFIDCPEGEDEERQACMFYKTVSNFS